MGKRVRLNDPEPEAKPKRVRLEAKEETPSSVAKGKVCTWCEHVYIYPCNGEDPQCMNNKWVRERQGKRRK
jgi:hypothetical protein